MDGIEFLKIIRSNSEFENIKVFVITTSNKERDKIMTKKFDVTGILDIPHHTDPPFHGN